MRLCVDVDGVIASLRSPGQEYRDVDPVPGAVERLSQLRAAGHYIILMTARHMRTAEGVVGIAVAREGATLLDWLRRHRVPFDEIWFGKPHADVYLDDNAMRFVSWDEISPDGNNLPISHEVKRGRGNA